MTITKALTYLLCLTLTSCASDHTRTTNSSAAKKHKHLLPKVPAKTIPGGTADNWRYLGTTSDKQLAIEINESSITSDNEAINYQDRKTLIDINNFDYQGLTAKYKYSLSWWQLSCQQQQYKIITTSIYDSYGNLIKKYNFTNTTASAINSGSIAAIEQAYICNGATRNIGY